MIVMARYLGEWGAGQVLLTPVPLATQPIRQTRTGRSRAVTIAWPNVIPHLDAAVPRRTCPGGA
jgi:hypothetical protein